MSKESNNSFLNINFPCINHEFTINFGVWVISFSYGEEILSNPFFIVTLRKNADE